MEGMQREIGSSKILFIQCNEWQLPRDHLRLKINSNDTYSRTLHPNNNCYSFTIEFKQPATATESLQHRINQCNRYQVLSIQLPIRSSLGLIYNSPHHHHTKNIKKLPLLAAPVVKKFNATIQHPPTMSHFIKSMLGNTTYDSFIDTHKELCFITNGDKMQLVWRTFSTIRIWKRIQQKDSSIVNKQWINPSSHTIIFSHWALVIIKQLILINHIWHTPRRLANC